MNQCTIHVIGAAPIVVNASAETVAEQINSARGSLLIPMLANTQPDEIDQGVEVTIYVAPDYITKVEPLAPV